MAKNDMAAHAAWNGQSNDSGCSEEYIDDLASMFIRNARGRMMDDDLRLKVLARAFAAEYVECRYDGDPFACLDEAEAFAGRRSHPAYWISTPRSTKMWTSSIQMMRRMTPPGTTNPSMKNRTRSTGSANPGSATGSAMNVRSITPAYRCSSPTVSR